MDIRTRKDLDILGDFLDDNFATLKEVEAFRRIEEILSTSYNKDCAVTQDKPASPKPSDDGFAQS